MKKAKRCSQALSQKIRDLGLVLYCALLLKEPLNVPVRQVLESSCLGHTESSKMVASAFSFIRKTKAWKRRQS